MESYHKLLLSILALLLVMIGYEYYFQNNNNTATIRIKLQHVQRLIDDVRNASADLNIVGPIGDLKFSEDDDMAKAILLEAICLKDDLIQECLFEAQQCINDAIRDLK